MSPPMSDDAMYAFSNITTILYLACCYTDKALLKNDFNERDVSHTSSVVREAAHQMRECFLNSSYLDNSIMGIILCLPIVGDNTNTVSFEIAEYITPYVYNQLHICSGCESFPVRNTDLA